MSNWSKAQQKRIVKKTAGTKRGRKMKPKPQKKPPYLAQKIKRPPKMTDHVIRVLQYVFGIDWTKEEACVMAHISTTTFDNWYNSKVQILWKFKEVWFDALWNTVQVDIELEVYFHEIMDHAMSQPFVRARQAQAKNIVKGKERTLDTFLTTRDERYKKKLDLDWSGIINVTFGMPPSPHIKPNQSTDDQ